MKIPEYSLRQADYFGWTRTSVFLLGFGFLVERFGMRLMART